MFKKSTSVILQLTFKKLVCYRACFLIVNIKITKNKYVEIESLKMMLVALIKKMTSAGQKKSNLYFALRSEDIRSLKDELHIVGLSSLTCSESHIFHHKGNYIINIVNTLNDILRRRGGNHVKKRYTFRPMQIASNYLSSENII